MFRYLSAVAVVMLAGTSTVVGQQPGKTTITWHGQSFFEIKSSKGTNIVCDPHNIQEYHRALGVKADAVLISHNHNDHTQVEVIDNYKDKDFKVIRGLDGTSLRAGWKKVDEKVKDVHVRSVGVYHDDMEGLKSGRNAVFVIEVDGWKIAHLGDLGHLLTDQQIKEIGPINVLLIPVGGVYTLNGAEAIKVVAQLKPKEYILPMHHATPVYDDLLSPKEFLEGMPQDKITRSKDNVLVLDRDPNRPRPQVVMLHYWPALKKKEKPADK